MQQIVLTKLLTDYEQMKKNLEMTKQENKGFKRQLVDLANPKRGVRA